MHILIKLIVSILIGLFGQSANSTDIKISESPYGGNTITVNNLESYAHIGAVYAFEFVETSPVLCYHNAKSNTIYYDSTLICTDGGFVEF